METGFYWVITIYGGKWDIAYFENGLFWFFGDEKSYLKEECIKIIGERIEDKND
jgi:hypothetical protein